MTFPYLDQLAKSSARPWATLPKSFGDSFVCSDRSVIRRGQDFAPSSALPNLLHPTRLVIGDLIPHTSWGASLANLLTKASWDKLRHPLIDQVNHACQLCGISNLPSYDVHEIWSYQMPTHDDLIQSQSQDTVAFGVQKLEGLVVLCKKCHACFHLGLANAQGRLHPVLSRLRVINNWTAEQLSLYKKTVFQRWEHHSQVPWILDFSGLTHPDGGLTIISTWQPLDIEGLFSRNDQFTGISGIPWRLSVSKPWQQGLSLE